MVRIVILGENVMFGGDCFGRYVSHNIYFVCVLMEII